MCELIYGIVASVIGVGWCFQNSGILGIPSVVGIRPLPGGWKEPLKRTPV